ncbi:M23 family metallopeptidase [Streptomyces sp. NPDC002602]|uniref:M23 family metallopeptidase n=1 Tax=Streptomyces sp. NPDC002602 TaxID=3364654 RepID=UPI0036C6A9AF
MSLYRACLIGFVALMLTDFALGFPFPLLLVLAPAPAGGVLLFCANRLAARSPHVDAPVREVGPPVAGRWLAHNSPADKVPSHGTHLMGQAFAIDVVAAPGDRPRPAAAWCWPPARGPRSYPAFGAPVYAVADAVVVRASDGRRDHLTRTSLPGMLYLMVIEAEARQFAGPGAILGNHLVLDLGDGAYAVYGHLRRGSLTVRAGERVSAGQVLAACGNSGNSTEPHVHFHLMDGPHPETARGLPFTWRGVGLPANGATFEATVEAPAEATVEATFEAAVDAPAEATVDAPAEAAVDAPFGTAASTLAADTDRAAVRGRFPG